MDHYVTGAIIRALREKRRMTQAELAVQLCVSDKAVSKWEKGKGLPDITLLEPIAEAMRRAAMITARHEMKEDGCFVHLAMSDGAGEIINLTLLCADEEQARRMEKNFRKKAESYYHQVVALFDKQ